MTKAVKSVIIKPRVPINSGAIGKEITVMAMNMKTIQLYAEDALRGILQDAGVGFTAEVGKDTGALTIKLESSVDVCGYSALIQFMFMKDGEVYFFALLDQIDVTVENAKAAFEVSTSTALNIALDDYLTVQLGAYLFDEETAGEMIRRYFDDFIYLLEEDENMKFLLSKMY